MKLVCFGSLGGQSRRVGEGGEGGEGEGRDGWEGEGSIPREERGQEIDTTILERETAIKKENGRRC